MTEETKHSKAYMKKLSAKIKSFTDSVSQKTQMNVILNVEYDKSTGYYFNCRISPDNFTSSYTDIILNSTSLQGMVREIKFRLSQPLDYRSTGRIKASKIKGSASLFLKCSSCEQNKHTTEFHRNIHTPIFAISEGYSFICHDCILQNFDKLLQERGYYFAFCWVCALYDRRFSVPLVDKVKGLEISVHEQCCRYFRLSNLTQETRKGVLFVDSDPMPFEN